jgi:IS5 family transposase
VRVDELKGHPKYLDRFPGCSPGRAEPAWSSAYYYKSRKEQDQAVGLEFNVNWRGTKSRPLNEAQRTRNRRLSRMRAAVGHPFNVVERLWRHAKVRYGSIKKNLAQVYTLFALANVCRVRRQLTMIT